MAAEAPQQPDAAQLEKQLNEINAELEKAHLEHKETSLDNLTPEHRELLKGMRAILEKEAIPNLESDRILIKFLITAGFNVEKGAKAYSDYRKWRIESKIDNVLQGPPPLIEVMPKLIPYAYHGFDKAGRPMYIEKTGKIRVNEMLQLVTAEDVVRSHVYGMEFLRNRMEESSKKLGKPVDTLTTILDLNGLGLSHTYALPMLQKATELDVKYYPELVSKIFVVNAPWIAPTVYEAIKRFLDESLKSKFVVLGSNFKEELLKHIDADQLPEEYGGTCKCKGGCVPEATDDELKELTHRDASGLKLDEVYVGAGYNHKVVLDGKKGNEFQWSFEVKDNYDVDFSIQMMEAGKDKPVDVKMNSRCVTNKGSYIATGDCSLTFLWDNSFSYFNGKYVKLHASVKQ